MNNVRKAYVRWAVVTTVGGLLLCTSMYWLLCSVWLRDQLRVQTVAAVQQATGAHVNFQSFDVHWFARTADFRHFVLRGTESATDSPLLRAATVHVKFSWSAFLRGRLAILSVSVAKPQLSLLVRSDGSTNLPHIPLTSRAQFGRFKLDRLDASQGVFEWNDRRVPFDVHASGVNIDIRSLPKRSRHDLSLTVESIDSDVAGDWLTNATASLQARIESDRAQVLRFVLKSPESSLVAGGNISQFAHPKADLQVRLDVEAPLLTRPSWQAQFTGGWFHAQGRLTYQMGNTAEFEGQLSGNGLDVLYSGRRATDVHVDSKIHASSAGAVLTDATAAALGAQFRGWAELKGWRSLAIQGEAKNADTNRLAEFLFHRRLPWSGLAEGSIHAVASLQSPNSASAQFTVHVSPMPHRRTLNADIAGRYEQATGQLQFQHFSAQLPDTRVEASGFAKRQLNFTLQSSNLAEIASVLPDNVVQYIGDGTALEFNGSLTGDVLSPKVAPQLKGTFQLRNFVALHRVWDRAAGSVEVSRSNIAVRDLTLTQASMHVQGSASLPLADWAPDSARPFRSALTFQGADLAQIGPLLFHDDQTSIHGVAAGEVHLEGTLSNPTGSAQLNIQSLDAFGQALNRMRVSALLENGSLTIPHAEIRAGQASLAFNGAYQHSAGDWSKGALTLTVNTNGFPLRALAVANRFAPDLAGQMQAHGTAQFQISNRSVVPVFARGHAELRQVAWRGVKANAVNVRAETSGDDLHATVDGVLTQRAPVPFQGNIDMDIASRDTLSAEIRASHVDVAQFLPLLPVSFSAVKQVSGEVSGAAVLHGSWAHPSELKTTLHLDEMNLRAQATGERFVFRNAAPVEIDLSGGSAEIRQLQLASREGQLSVRGSIEWAGSQVLQLETNGEIDLSALQLLDTDLASAGQALVTARIGGTVTHPEARGSLAITNGSFHFQDFPAGLTNVNGKVSFTGDRAVIEHLAGESGGGSVQLSGFVSLGADRIPSYNLKAVTENVRVRYANSLSATGSGTLQLAGSTRNGLLSGSIAISRIVASPDSDLGKTLETLSVSNPAPAGEQDFLSGLRLDVHLASSPNLQINTSLSQDIEADIDLQLRGSLQHPFLFGSITANQGDIKVFGAKYSINYGEITFVNTARIEPVLDLDLQTLVRGVTVDITISGTLNKLNINYRSDPPLQPKDIIALLTVGQAPSFAPSAQLPNAQPTNNDVSALQAGANTVLGQAISPSSNRLSKLFGITNIKIDPLVQGVINTPQSWVTVEQQVSKNVTVTYVTNLAQTSEQIFRFEWALSPQYSVVAVRDDNGEFGIDFQYKRRFK